MPRGMAKMALSCSASRSRSHRYLRFNLFLSTTVAVATEAVVAEATVVAAVVDMAAVATAVAVALAKEGNKEEILVRDSTILTLPSKNSSLLKRIST
jgi:hypothetical protein